MKTLRFLSVVLTVCLLATGMTSCELLDILGAATAPSDTTEQTDTTPTCDMAEVKAEIDSMEVSDFTETSEITEYVKITVRDHGEMIIRLRSDVAPISVSNFAPESNINQ